MKLFLENLEQFVIEVILHKKKGLRASVLRILLYFLSKIYKYIVNLRLFLYRNRILREHTLGCMVISIGNLTVGGTGKTPVVEKIAKILRDSGRKVAILSRGYKSEKPSLLKKIKFMLSGKTLYYPPRVVSDGKKVLLDSRFAGDEPFMLASNIDDVVVMVDKDRVKSGLYAIKNFGVDTLLLDDGLQYLKLKHRLDLVLIDKFYPFGNEYLLPRGTLRESAKSLKRASYIFITKCDSKNNGKLIKRIRNYNKTAEIIESSHKPCYLINIVSEEKKELSFLKGKDIGAISAIAVPESFENGLKKLGSNVVVSLRFADHHRFNEKEVDTFLKRCSECDVDVVLTTEKDSVRFPKFENYGVQVFYLRVEIEIINGQDSWAQCIKRICKPRPMKSARRFF